MNTEPLYEKFTTYIKQKGLKSTKQRDVIVQTFFKQEGHHIKIEDLLKLVNKKDTDIGYATVYRTLNLLVDAGVAHKRQFDSGHSLFELNSDHHHDHLICTNCEKIVEFENDDIEALQEKVAKKHKFKLTRHKMELYGLCQSCQKI